MDYLYYTFGTLIFIAVVLLIEALHLLWNGAKGPQAERIARRLRLMSSEGAGDGYVSMIRKRKLSESARLQRWLEQVPRVAALDRVLEQSGLGWSVAKFGKLMLVCALAGAGGAAFLGLRLPGLLAMVAAASALPTLQVLRSKSKRILRIELQLPDALDLMSRALRAGHAFPSALRMAGDESHPPLAEEFRAAFDEVNFGLSMHDALMNLAARVPSTDLRYFVIAVLIQRETGGNLSELLESISAIIRDRIKLLGQVRVLSAEGRLSAWILSLLPFGAALMIQISNPEFLAVLYNDPMGLNLIFFAAFMMALGVLVMRNIIRIRV
jgi:tight adherence protein B